MKKFIPPILPIILAFISLMCDIEDVNIPPEPEVHIALPTASALMLDTTRVLIEASDDRGIARVDLYIDGSIPRNGRMYFEPYEYRWDLQQYVDSSKHTLYAIAYDTDSNFTTSHPIDIVTFRFSPSTFVADVVNDTLLRFTWKDHSSQETGFQLFESVNDSAYLLVRTVPANITTIDYPGIFSKTNKYEYVIRAFKDSTYSKFSNTQMVYVSLSPPSGLFITSVTDTLIQLQWQKGARAYEEYVEIEERAGTGEFVKRATVPAGSRTVEIKGSYVAGTTYYFRARAFTKHSASEYSNIVSTKIAFPNPTGLICQHSGNASVRLSWLDKSEFENGFAVERSEYGSGIFSEIHRTGSGVTEWIDMSVDTSKMYQWRVRAFSDVNVSAYSPVTTGVWFTEYQLNHSFSRPGVRPTGLRFIPHSSVIAVSFADNTWILRDVAAQTTLSTKTANTNGIYSMDVSPDGTIIATGGGDGTITLWDGNTGDSLRSFSAHTGRVNDIDFSDDGLNIVSGGADSIAKVWDVQQGQLHTLFSEHHGAVHTVRFHPNGTNIISGDENKTLLYWTIPASSVVWSKQMPVVRINTAEFLGNGDTVVVGTDTPFGNPLFVITVASAGNISIFKKFSNTINSITHNNRRNTIVTSSDDGTIATFHRSLSFVTSNISTGSIAVSAIAHNTTGTILASTLENGTVMVWASYCTWKRFIP